MKPGPVTSMLAVLMTLLTQLPATASLAEIVPIGVWPLWPQPAVLTPFDVPSSKYGAGHRGVDLAGAPAQTVRSALPGTVSFAGRIAGRGVVVVQHGETRTTYEPVSATIPVGTAVAAGAGIGTLELVGSHCFPRACLHWGWLRASVYLDPLGLVGAVRVRLVPLSGLPQSGPRMGLLIGPTQPVSGHVGVQLRRRQGGVAQDFLHRAQVRTAL